MAGPHQRRSERARREIATTLTGITARTATGETLTGPAIDSVNTFEAPKHRGAEADHGDSQGRPAVADARAEVGDGLAVRPVRPRSGRAHALLLRAADLACLARRPRRCRPRSRRRSPGAKPVTVERIKVHGAALEGNLEGNAADRDVLVFLPPSYAKEKSRRYPVVYALHGYSIGAEQWST